MIRITEPEEKCRIARKILESLPRWFGIVEAREAYIFESGNQVFFAAIDENGTETGFLCLKETGKSTVELAVMGVLEEYHRQGIGTQLFEEACHYARNSGYEFIQVKTVAMGYYDDYDETNQFYQSLGFKELELIPALWGEKNPCQIYIMSIGR